MRKKMLAFYVGKQSPLEPKPCPFASVKKYLSNHLFASNTALFNLLIDCVCIKNKIKLQYISRFLVEER